MTNLKPKQYTVKIRRGDGWEVKPSSECIDGKKFMFRPGWQIEAEDSGIYVGETAMISDWNNWPQDAPSWIASGDLEEVL